MKESKENYCREYIDRLVFL